MTPRYVPRAVLALTLASLAGIACAQDPIRLETRTDAVSPNRTGAQSQTPGITSNGEALGVLIAIHEHQVATTELAQTKGVNSGLMDLARDIERIHRASQSETRRVGRAAGVVPFDSDDVAVVRERAAAERAQLAALGGAEFELAFVDALAQINRDAITAIDVALLPASSDASIQAHLRESRERFVANLTRIDGFVPPTAAR